MNKLLALLWLTWVQLWLSHGLFLWTWGMFAKLSEVHLKFKWNNIQLMNLIFPEPFYNLCLSLLIPPTANTYHNIQLLLLNKYFLNFLTFLQFRHCCSRHLNANYHIPFLEPLKYPPQLPANMLFGPLCTHSLNSATIISKHDFVSLLLK